MKALTIALSLLTLSFVSVQNNQPTRMPEVVAIFAVRHDQQSFVIDPIVVVHYGSDQRFKTIPALNAPIPERNFSDSDFDRIEHSFYKPGTLVSMFSGGEKVGTATIRSSNIEGRDGGCVDLSAVVSFAGNGAPKLATNTSSEIPGRVSTKRAATQTEKSTLLKVAIQWLSDYGIDKQLLLTGKLGQVTSTVLRQNAGRALIGRFDVASRKAVFRLFAVAEPERTRYRLTLADLDVQHDIEDGTDKTEREYVDQLDINNDGADEVVTSASHYESWSYTVWKFDEHNAAWGRAYTGGGGGC